MSDQRRLGSIGARYDVEVSRHPDPWRMLRSRLSWIFALGTTVACIPWLLGDHRTFQSECVSDAHRVFGQNCQACHDRSLVPLQRMVTLNNRLHSTSDTKCQKCHRETNSDHLSEWVSTPERHASLEESLKSKFDQIGCAGCHTEHRGVAALTHVTDANCTQCHSEIHEKVSPKLFELDFKGFRQHPEFAVWRQESHLQRASRDDRSKRPNIRWEGEQPLDQSAIKFSHHRHLDPALLTPGGKPTELRCIDCHQADQSGAYFRPIQFEQHCHRCHQIGFPETGKLPHAKPEIIRGILLDGLAKNSNVSLPQPQDPLGGPTKRPIDLVKSAAELEPLFKDQLEALENRLFHSSQEIHEQPQAVGLLQAACTKCHYTEKTNAITNAWKVVPPQVPDSWMSHNRFRHDRHASVECTLCHTRGGQKSETVDLKSFYPKMSKAAGESSSIYASVAATDILMPRIDVCRNCHGHESPIAASVTDKCVDCHDYHHETRSKPLPAGIRELLSRGSTRLETTTPISNPESR